MLLSEVDFKMNDIKTNTYPENDYRAYLEHHGVPGQKWGVRNAKWYPIEAYRESLANDGSEKNRNRIAKDSAKHLNKIDKKNAFNKRYLREALDEEKFYSKKNQKLKSKYKEATSESKRQKLKAKMDVNNERIKVAQKTGKKYMKDISIANKEVNDLTNYLRKNGYNVDRKAIQRSVTTKGEFAAQIGIGLLTGAMGGILVTKSNFAPGTKYKVRNGS